MSTQCHEKRRRGGICEQRRPRSACASAQADQGLSCPPTVSLGTVDYVDFQLRFLSGCVTYLADLNLYCPRRHFFSKSEIHLYSFVLILKAIKQVLS